MKENSDTKYKKYTDNHDYNCGKIIWEKVRKSSKTGQKQKTLRSALASFLTAITKVLFLLLLLLLILSLLSLLLLVSIYFKLTKP